MDQKYLDEIEAFKAEHATKVGAMGENLKLLLSERDALRKDQDLVRDARAKYLSGVLKEPLEEYNVKVRNLRLNLTQLEARITKLENRREEEIKRELLTLKLRRLQEHEEDLKRWIADPRRNPGSPPFYFYEEVERVRLRTQISQRLGFSEAFLEHKEAKKKFEVDLANLERQLGQFREACVSRAREMFPDTPDYPKRLMKLDAEIERVAKELNRQEFLHKGKLSDLRQDVARRANAEQLRQKRDARFKSLGLNGPPSCSLLRAEEELRNTEAQIKALEQSIKAR